VRSHAETLQGWSDADRPRLVCGAGTDGPPTVRLLAAADLELVAVDPERRQVPPVLPLDDTRNGADRRYPVHLDTILDPRMGEWWGSRYGLARPPETFFRDKRRRDAQRARGRWEVRVKQTSRDAEPPIVPDGRPGRRL
jgi:hypothetical protein